MEAIGFQEGNVKVSAKTYAHDSSRMVGKIPTPAINHCCCYMSLLLVFEGNMNIEYKSGERSTS
jgi:hypothetical protein